MRRRSAAFGITLLALANFATGCSANLYSDAISQFNSGTTNGSKIVSDRAQAFQTVVRRKQLDKTFYADENPATIDPAKLTKFAGLVCASTDYLRLDQTDISTLDTYNTALQTINKKPDQNIGSLLKSIRDNWSSPEALKPGERKSESSLKCSTEVGNLVTLPPDVIPEFAPAAIGAALDAASSLYSAANKLAVSLLSITDDAVRGEKIRQYVLACQDTVNTALNDLNKADPQAEQLCSQLRTPNQAPCDPKTRPTALDGVTIAEKWVALREPWHLYLSMYSTQTAYEAAKKAYSEAPDPGSQHHTVAAYSQRKLHRNVIQEAAASKDPSAYFYLLDKQQDDLNNSLGDYVTLAKTPGTGDVARAMKNANDTLLRLANGNLTAAEAWGILSDYASRVKTIQSNLSTLKTATSTFETKVSGVAQ